MQRSATFGYRLTTTLYETKATRDTFSKVRFTVKNRRETMNFIPLRANNSSINQQYIYIYPRNQFSYTYSRTYFVRNPSFSYNPPPPSYISIFAQSSVQIFSRTTLCPCICIPSSRPFSSSVSRINAKGVQREKKRVVKENVYIIKEKRGRGRGL